MKKNLKFESRRQRLKKNVRNAPRGMGVLVGEKILNIVQGMVRYALGYFLMNYIGWPSYYSLLL